LRLVAGLAGKLFFGLETKVDQDVSASKEAFLVVANHQSYADPVFAIRAFKNRYIHFVAGRYLFYFRWIAAIFRAMGVIAKQQLRPDAATIREIFARRDSGQSVLLYVEGQRSIDGRTNPIAKTTGKFLKRLGMPVVALKTAGSYLVWPRWSAAGPRFGKVSQKVSFLFSKADLAALTEEEIMVRLTAELEHDDYEWQKKQKIPYKYKGRRPAENLHAVLHYCPSCETFFTLDSADNRLFCRHCGAAAVMDSSGLLKCSDEALPDSPAIWHDRQIAAWNRYVDNNGGIFSFTSEFRYYTHETGEKTTGRGVVTVSDDRYTAVFDDGNKVEFVKEPHPALDGDYGIYFGLSEASGQFRIYPDDGQMVAACLDRLLGQNDAESDMNAQNS
jgi:1-acyl-sn-glycerol-3-phosphate acyltransferase